MKKAHDTPIANPKKRLRFADIEASESWGGRELSPEIPISSELQKSFDAASRQAILSQDPQDRPSAACADFLLIDMEDAFTPSNVPPASRPSSVTRPR